MSSLQPHGVDILDVEVTHISSHGIWLLAQDHEMFLSYDEYPWFKEASISDIIHVEALTSEHFYWPKLDVDLGIESIKHPERFPLKAKGGKREEI